MSHTHITCTWETYSLEQRACVCNAFAKYVSWESCSLKFKKNVVNSAIQKNHLQNSWMISNYRFIAGEKRTYENVIFLVRPIAINYRKLFPSNTVVVCDYIFFFQLCGLERYNLSFHLQFYPHFFRGLFLRKPVASLMWPWVQVWKTAFIQTGYCHYIEKRNWNSWPLKMVTISCPETSVTINLRCVTSQKSEGLM